jgi:hypothetical protein
MDCRCQCHEYVSHQTRALGVPRARGVPRAGLCLDLHTSMAAPNASVPHTHAHTLNLTSQELATALPQRSLTRPLRASPPLPPPPGRLAVCRLRPVRRGRPRVRLGRDVLPKKERIRRNAANRGPTSSIPCVQKAVHSLCSTVGFVSTTSCS